MKIFWLFAIFSTLVPLSCVSSPPASVGKERIPQPLCHNKRNMGKEDFEENLTSVVAEIKKRSTSTGRPLALAFDIDGTILNGVDSLEVYPVLLETYVQLLEKGHSIIFVTGGAEVWQVPRVLTPLEKSLAKSPALLSKVSLYVNGGGRKFTWSSRNNAFTTENEFNKKAPQLSADLIKRLSLVLERLGKQGFNLTEMQKREWKIFFAEKFDDGYVDVTKWDLPWTDGLPYKPRVVAPEEFKGLMVIPLIENRNNQALAIKPFNTRPDIRLAVIWPAIKAVLTKEEQEKLYPLTGGPYTLDILQRILDKAYALRNFSEENNLKAEQIIFFGDSFYRQMVGDVEKIGNDVAALDGSLLGVAVNPKFADFLEENQSRVCWVGTSIETTHQLLKKLTM